jgi:hypothetical protein
MARLRYLILIKDQSSFTQSIDLGQEALELCDQVFPYQIVPSYCVIVGAGFAIVIYG